MHISRIEPDWAKNPIRGWRRLVPMTRDLGIAIDLGATRMRVCIGTKSGRILRRKSGKMVLTKGVEDYLSQITGMTKEIVKDLGGKDVQGICVASPGPLDLKRGSIVHTANLPYPEVKVVEALEESFGTEVRLVNDANAGALGEWLWGAGKGHGNVSYVTMSTGIGGGAVVDGRLLLGKQGNAAEVGHMTIDSSGRMKCGCGRRGHWEAYCSGSGIPRFTRWLADELGRKREHRFAKSPLLRREGPSDAAAVFREAEGGDLLASEVLKEVGRLNAIGVANVTDAFDPEIVTVGGGVALNNPDAVLTPIRSLVGDYAINSTPDIMVTKLGDDVGLLGALSVSFNPELIIR